MEKITFQQYTNNTEIQDIGRIVEQNKVDTYNSGIVADDGTGIQCDNCGNRGSIAFIGESGRFTVKDCKCKGTRLTVNRLQRQGLYDRVKRCKLDEYRVETEVQKILKQKTAGFIKDLEPHWLALCGAPGVGKTHLATAAFTLLSFKRGMNGRYFLWNSDSRRVKAASVDGDEKPLNEVKQCELLYIDDLFKCKKGSEPSDADIRLCFEILDYRYNKKLPTIISTEMLSEDIAALDFAIFRRIREMCGDYIVDVERDTEKCFFPSGGVL